MVAEDLKRKLRENPTDEQLLLGANKFVERYLANKTNVTLTSALHRFGWVFGGSTSSQKFGTLRYGKNITLQATAAGRRRKGAIHGKTRLLSGKPAGM